MKLLITGAAGFIGAHVSALLAGRGDEVVGIDNLNDYYDPGLKIARLRELGITMLGDTPSAPVTLEDGEPCHSQDLPVGLELRSVRFPTLRFIRMDICDRERLPDLFRTEAFDGVVNLAAQAGVRYSLENPFAYVESNVMGFVNVLECCRQFGIKHLVFASSSSVYGMDSVAPFSEREAATSPVSVYAATKRSNELLAHTYAHLYRLPCTGLRYFTVYGPWGRPDMAPMLFARAISRGDTIRIFNHGDLMRDFTYIDDIAEGTVRALDRPPTPDGAAPARVFNIGCSTPVRLMDFIATLEQTMGRTARREYVEMQDGDVYQTNADTSLLEVAVGYRPRVQLREGLRRFVTWWERYYTQG